MTPPRLNLPLLLEIPNMYPGIAATSRHESSFPWIQCYTTDLFEGLDMLDGLWGWRGGYAREEDDMLPRRDGEEITVEFEGGGGGGGEGVGGDAGAGAEVVPAEGLVFGGGREDVRVGRPDYGFDRARVFAGADFVAWRRCGRVAVRVAVAVGDLGVLGDYSREIPDA